MTKKNIFPVVATIAVVGVVLGVFSMTVMRDSNVSISTMTSEQAYANLSSKMKRIGVQEVKVNPQQLDVSEFLDAKDELPDIESSYPFVVVGNGDVNIEIFSSGEKAAESGSDSFLTEMAKKFNAQHNKTSGDKTMSVSLRSIPSGTAAEYISTGKYQPECYTPSNTLFGELVKNEGVELTVEADRLVGNVAGILVSKKTGDMLRSEYGEASVSSVLNATIDGKLMMGYSNPYTSATGLNFLLAALASSGSDTIVDTAAVENFQKFQANVPLVSFTTQQMVQSADKGIVDGVVMEYQSYQNDPTLQRNYEFIPFGVRHDNPLYSIGSISAEKKEVIAAFVSLCAQNQAEATKDGFNGLDDYAYTGKAYDGNTIAQAQSVWKEEKDSGIPIVAEFVVDTSGSMRGINTKDILRHPFAIRENNCTVGEISVIHTKTGFFQGYNSIAMQLYGEEYQSYKIGFGKEGVCCPVFLGGQQIAQINKSAVVKDNLDEYLIYAVNEKALMPSVMFAIYIDGIYYANRGMYVDDATTINCEYSLNEEVLSHYDPNFVKGL